MKVSAYAVSSPWPKVCKQWSVMAKDEQGTYWPLIYLQRPKWIEDDSAWEKICESIQLKLPKGFEVTK